MKPGNSIEMPKQLTDLNTSLIQSIGDENIKEIGLDTAELTLDAFMDDGFLKDIPFFGLLYKGYKATAGIREAIFARKVYSFLTQLHTIPKKKRDEFVSKIECTPAFGHKVGEKLIMIIDRMDDLEKPSIVGKLLKACINDHIDYELFLRLSMIVQQAFLPDLKKFLQYPWTADGPLISKVQTDHFVSLGLMITSLSNPSRDMALESAAVFTGSRESKLSVPKMSAHINSIGLALIKNTK